jgi:hypothetical protein
MRYKLTLFFEDNINELLDILDKYNIAYSLEELQIKEEDL